MSKIFDIQCGTTKGRCLSKNNQIPLCFKEGDSGGLRLRAQNIRH